MESIECAFLSDYNYYVDAILSYTLSTFRVVNFFKEFYKEKIQNVNSSDFIDNDYFYIKNFDVKEPKNDNLVLKENKESENIQKLLACDNNYVIIENGTIEKIINEIVAKERINIFYSAVGYAFRSGLKMIEDSFQILSNNSGECELIVGALQNHNHPTANNKIDRNSAEYLNVLIKKTGIKLFTYTPAFYHGKFYYKNSLSELLINIKSMSKTQMTLSEHYVNKGYHIQYRDNPINKINRFFI